MPHPIRPPLPLLLLLALLPSVLNSSILFTGAWDEIHFHLVTVRENRFTAMLAETGYCLIAVGIENRGRGPLLLSPEDKWDFYRHANPYYRVDYRVPKELSALFASPGLDQITSHWWRADRIEPGQRGFFFFLLPLFYSPEYLRGVRYLNRALTKTMVFGGFELPGEYALDLPAKAAAPIITTATTFELPTFEKKPVNPELSFQKIYDLFNPKSTLTPIEKKNHWDKLKGTAVVWTGLIRSIENYQGNYKSCKLDVGFLKPGGFDTIAIFETPNLAIPRPVNSSLTITGYLWDFNPGSQFNVTLQRCLITD